MSTNLSDEDASALPPTGGETFSLIGLEGLGAEQSRDPGATVSPLLGQVLSEVAASSGEHRSSRSASTDRSGGLTVAFPVGTNLPQLRTRAADADIQVLGPLAEGGMGRIDLALQRALDREVAIKRVRPDRSTPSAIRALLDEARLTGALEHPSIIPVHTLGLDELGDPVLVMKRVEGVSWRELIRQPDHPAWGDHREDRLGRHLDILIQVCNAVHFAHSRGIIHRDLKTENVMLGAFGEIYVLDWGIASRLGAPRANVIAGTPAFMAPEMLDLNAPLTVQTDVYLLGGMLHQALTGRHRHTGGSTAEVLAAARTSAPPVYGPEIPSELAELCIRATARDPAERPADALVFQQALIDYKRHRGSVALSDLAHQTLQGLDEAIDRQRRALAQGEDEAELDSQRAAIRRLAAEATFGFRQALRQWPENRPATRGLEACLLRSAEFELDERNVFAATTLLADLGSKAPQLQARLADLRRSLEVEGRASVELSQLRHESSSEVALSVRTWVMFAVHFVLGVFWLGMARIQLEFTHVAIIGFAASLLLTLAVSFTLLRQTLLANQFNRRILYSLVAFCVFTMVHASLGIIREVPVDHLAWGGYLGISLMFAVMALTMAPTFGLLVPPTLLAAFYCALFPEQVNESLALFNFGCALMWLVPLGLARIREARRP